MKKLLALAGIAAMILVGTEIKAQNYASGVGGLVEFGERGLMAGPQYKHFFGEYTAGEFSALFSESNYLAQANFQFQYPLFNSRSLDFYLGAGPAIMYGKNIHDNEKSIYFAPAAMAGLDLTLGDLPLSISADWRPRVFLGKDYYTGMARFGAGIKYTFQ